MDFTGKVCIVTGAANGMGRETAALLSYLGMSVVIADINGDAALSVADQLTADGRSAMAVTVDVSVEDDVVELVAATKRQFGGIDYVHNNAALVRSDVIAQDKLIEAIDPAVFASVLAVNVIGPALLAKHAIPSMISRGGGVVINTASVGALRAELDRPMYGASKAALAALTRSIATQYGRQGIRAVTICPGLIVTPGAQKAVSAAYIASLTRHCLTSRPGCPLDVAALVAFLLTDDAGFITGIDIPVDGGMIAHFPTYADEIEAASSATGVLA